MRWIEKVMVGKGIFIEHDMMRNLEFTRYGVVTLVDFLRSGMP